MFYLPIFVNNRRMHILPLMNEVDPKASTQLFHSFVMCSNDRYQVFSLPSSEAKLISDVLSEENVELREYDFSLSKLEVSPYADRFPDMPCYRFLIKPGTGNKVCNAENFYIDGYIGSDYTSPDCFRVEANSTLLDHAYILQICYEQHIRDNNGNEIVRNYSSAIRIYTYRIETDEVVTAALDFGSEASQIKFKDDRETLNVREVLCDLTGIDKNEEHWQGRPSDDPEKKRLYKSIYHINTKPAPTFFGDLPMNHGDQTFIQTLLPVTHSDFSNLVLLPNLKLIELLRYNISAVDVDFGEATKTNLIHRRKESLDNEELQHAILRQILCNFLAVTMYRKRVEEDHSLCLRFTILIPNVYYQQKVSQIIDGLYEDFDLLVQNHPDLFGCYRGIEVNMISESDASYFGVMQQSLDVRNSAAKKGSYCLMIDAGKGTTDFSLLHQIGNQLSHYESIYRSGIPASGHVLTYAFYEALRDYFTSINHGAVFEKIIRSAYDGTLQTKHLLDFVARLEEQKAHYGKYRRANEREILNTAMSVNTWDDLNGFLMELNTKEIQIPGAESRVNEKVAQMVQLLESSIEAYAEKRKITFLKVFLSGRAFKFKPFKKAVIDSLIKHGLVLSANQIDYTERLAKTACMNGGLKEGDYNVNRKSTMLSVPSMQEIVGQVSSIRQCLRQFFRRDKVLMANIDFDFFYKGLKKGNVSNVEIDICGRGEPKSFPTAEDVYLYFVGDGYLLKSDSRCERIDESGQNYSFGNDEEEILNQLMCESLFPFDLRSMGYSALTNVSKRNLEAKLEQERASSDSTQTSHGDTTHGVFELENIPDHREDYSSEQTNHDNSPFGEIN